MMTTDKAIRITAVRAVDNGARLLLEIVHENNGEVRRETLTLFAARLQEIPHTGTVNADTYAEFAHESAITEAVTLGLRLLAFGDTSASKMVEKLRSRAVAPSVSREAVDLLIKNGYLDEKRGALAAAKADLFKLWGDKRILAALAARGYRGEALAAVKEMLQGENSVLRCAKLIKKRRMALPREEDEIAGFAAKLMRYGYTVREIKAALLELDLV